MPLRALDPEPSVSTSSTTSAYVSNVTEGYDKCQINICQIVMPR